ncbi:hypothetical protein KBD33_04850, partial [Candidatus Gracilibacteria bacterium]|nr:hypothetical protein [Candidatus Gracilibacteria bacterium]
MFTIRGISSLGKNGVKWNAPSVGADVSQNIDSPEKKLATELLSIDNKFPWKVGDSFNDLRLQQFKKAIQQAYPDNLAEQLKAVQDNTTAAGNNNPIGASTENIPLRMLILDSSKKETKEQITSLLVYAKDLAIESIPTEEQNSAMELMKKLELLQSKFEQSERTTKTVVKNQLEGLKRENEFALKNVSWTGLLSMIKQEQGRGRDDISHKLALDNLVSKFDNQGWEASRDNSKDNDLLAELEKAGYLRYSGSVASMEYGHKVVVALREIQKDWNKYEKVIRGTEALDARSFRVPDSKKFSEWRTDI